MGISEPYKDKVSLYVYLHLIILDFTYEPMKKHEKKTRKSNKRKLTGLFYCMFYIKIKFCNRRSKGRKKYLMLPVYETSLHFRYMAMLLGSHDHILALFVEHCCSMFRSSEILRKIKERGSKQI